MFDLFYKQVHRQLLEALSKDNLGDNLEEHSGIIGDRELSELCSHMNKKKRVMTRKNKKQ